MHTLGLRLAKLVPPGSAFPREVVSHLGLDGPSPSLQAAGLTQLLSSLLRRQPPVLGLIAELCSSACPSTATAAAATPPPSRVSLLAVAPPAVEVVAVIEHAFLLLLLPLRPLLLSLPLLEPPVSLTPLPVREPLMVPRLLLSRRPALGGRPSPGDDESRREGVRSS